jgi:hypothetical protein
MNSLKKTYDVAYDATNTSSRILKKVEGRQGYVINDGKWFLATCKNGVWVVEE